MKESQRPPSDADELSDEQLEKIFEQLATFDASESLDDEVARAHDAIKMIQRVRKAEDGETARDADTKASRFVRSRFEVPGGKFELPSRIGRFDVKRTLGQGGFGVVLLAHDPNLGRDVALKIPRPEIFEKSDLDERFIREGRAAASLAHPNIVPVYESGQLGWIYYIASQFVPGATLDRFAELSREQLDFETIARVVASLADAMQHAHQRGILHRDLKPTNILVEESDQPIEDRVRVTDFGLAKSTFEPSQTQTGAVIGTPSYMSPEQTRGGDEVGPATDIYALGGILYFLLTGAPPFENSNMVDTVNAVRNLEPALPRSVNPQVPIDLQAVCMKCLEKSASRRYASAFHLAEDLRRFTSDRPVLARNATIWNRAARWVLRNPVVSGLLVALFATSLVAGVQLIKSESLMKDLVVKQSRIEVKSEQIRQAIDRLFIAVASTPEMKLASLDPLRKKLIAEANSMYVQLVDDVPDDPALFEAHIGTKLSYARLCSSLGQKSEAYSIFSEIKVQVDEFLASHDIDASAVGRLVVLKLKGQVEILNYQRPSPEGQELQAEVLALIDSDSIADESFVMARASALSSVAKNAVVLSDYTSASAISRRSLDLWETIDPDTIENPEDILDLVSAYESAIRVCASSENPRDGIPLANTVLGIFGIDESNLDSQELNSELPETQVAFAAILNDYASLLPVSESDRAIELAGAAYEVATELALTHREVADYHVSKSQFAYNYGLSYFKASKFDEAETVFRENIEALGGLIVRFPETLAFDELESNFLWMLGLVCKKRFDWPNQLIAYQQAKSKMETTRKPSAQRPTLVAGLAGEIGFCKHKLGDSEEGFEIVVSAITDLDDIIEADPANGQAKRFLHGNLEFASEIARRLMRYQTANDLFGRQLEMQGGQSLPKQLSTRIELAVGLSDVTRAQQLLDEYGSTVNQLRNADRFHDSKMFAFTFKRIQAELQRQPDNDDLTTTAQRVVESAVLAMRLWLDASDNTDGVIQKIEAEPELEVIREQDAYRELLDEFQSP